jgi:hypothetical protein
MFPAKTQKAQRKVALCFFYLMMKTIYEPGLHPVCTDKKCMILEDCSQTLSFGNIRLTGKGVIVASFVQVAESAPTS